MFETWEDGLVTSLLRVRRDVLGDRFHLGNPILHLGMNRQDKGGKSECVGRGVVTSEVNNEEVAEDLVDGKGLPCSLATAGGLAISQSCTFMARAKAVMIPPDSGLPCLTAATSPSTTFIMCFLKATAAFPIMARLFGSGNQGEANIMMRYRSTIRGITPSRTVYRVLR